MAGIEPLDRRTFLTRFGQGTLAVAIFGFAACSDSGGEATTTAAAASAAATTTTAESTTTTRPATTTTSAESSTTAEDTTSTTKAPIAAGNWARVDLGFVSAYVLLRDGEAVVVDTGVPGSASDIEMVLTDLGSGWQAVRHVILTHLHNDHIGGLGEVMTRAPEAAGYAGAADIPGINSPRPLAPVGDGDEVFGLQIIDTPGHTPGHISVLDPIAGVMVAGDAINGTDAAGGAAGGVAGPNPEFTPDMAAAIVSVGKMAGFDYDRVFFGHGSPVASGGSDAVAALAAGL